MDDGNENHRLRTGRGTCHRSAKSRGAQEAVGEGIETTVSWQLDGRCCCVVETVVGNEIAAIA